MIARGSDCGDHCDFDGTVDTSDGSGSPRPWDPRTWLVTVEQTRAAEAYFMSKTLAEQVAVTDLIVEIERIGLPPVRSRTTTDDVPWLKQPGAAARIAAEWHARLEGK